MLRLQGAWSATHPGHDYALDYARRVNELSDGRLRVEILPAGTVVDPPNLLDAVEKGVIDGCHASPLYWSHKDASFSLFGAGPSIGLDADGLLAWMRYGGGQALYEELYASLLYRNVVGRVYGPLPPRPLGWFRQPVVSAAQFKGLRCAARGLPARLLRELGATVRDLPDAEVAAAARRGELDAVAFEDVLADPGFALAERFPILMLQSHHQPAPVFEILLNRRRLAALPPGLRAVLAHAADAASADLAWKAAQREAQAFETLRVRAGVRFVDTPQPVLAAQLKAWRTTAQRLLRDNPFFPKIFRSQQLWVRRTVRWTAATALDPRPALAYWTSAGGADQPDLP